ncbi:MAG: glycosyltransferase family 39 protein [bacterium]|nr:glycosyltransferase family 39 protein [bacterium]
MQLMNPREFFQKHKVGIIIFLIALAVRLTLFFINLNAAQGDFIDTIRGQDGYYEISKNLIEGNGFSSDSGPVFKPESLRPPVWIFIMAFVAKIFGSYVPVFILEIILGSFIPILGMYLSRRIISPKYVPVVGFLLALEPYSILLSILTISETCFTFLFLVSLVFLFRYVEEQSTRNAVWYGVFLGLAIMVKPTVQFFPIIVPVALLFFLRKNNPAVMLKHFACFITVCLLIIAPWIYRNYKEFDAFGISAQPAYNLYTVLAPTVLSIDSGRDFTTEHAAVHSIIYSRGETEITLANGDRYIKEALSIISEHKIALVKSILISIVTFFTHDGMLTVLGYAGETVPNLLSKPALILLLTDPLELARDILAYSSSFGILIFFGRLFWIVVTFLFFVGGGFYLRTEKFSPFACVALAVVAYFALLTAVNGFGMNARFRVPVNVFIFTFAIHGFFYLKRGIINKLSSHHA